MSRGRAWCRSAAAVAFPVVLFGCVSSTPVNVSGTYQDRVPPRPAAPAASPVAAGCGVLIDQITDSRTDPSVLGVVLGRAVKGPADAQAWLRSVLGGLPARGVPVAFAASDPGAAAALVHLSIELRTAWVTTTSSNKNANVLLRAVLTKGSEPPVERNIRGIRSSINWNASDSELQSLVNAAFGSALDQLADSIRPMCHP